MVQRRQAAARGGERNRPVARDVVARDGAKAFAEAREMGRGVVERQSRRPLTPAVHELAQ